MQTQVSHIAGATPPPDQAGRKEPLPAAECERLFSTYGERMTSENVATELGYSLTYFLKKIGSEKHRHLDWVSFLFPVRIRHGRVPYYPTQKVARLLHEKGLLK